MMLRSSARTARAVKLGRQTLRRCVLTLPVHMSVQQPVQEAGMVTTAPGDQFKLLATGALCWTGGGGGGGDLVRAVSCGAL